MKKNMGSIDVVIRLVLAALLLISYFAFNLRDWLGLIVIILIILLVFTSVVRVCPLYYIFRTDTLKKEEKL